MRSLRAARVDLNGSVQPADRAGGEGERLVERVSEGCYRAADRQRTGVEGERAAAPATIAVPLGTPDRSCPAEEAAGEVASGTASATACGESTTEPSAAAGEISTAGMSRHRSTARRALIASADIAYRPRTAAPGRPPTLLLKVMAHYLL